MAKLPLFALEKLLSTLAKDPVEIRICPLLFPEGSLGLVHVVSAQRSAKEWQAAIFQPEGQEGENVTHQVSFISAFGCFGVNVAGLGHVKCCRGQCNTKRVV